jgi:hypothetical protein
LFGSPLVVVVRLGNPDAFKIETPDSCRSGPALCHTPESSCDTSHEPATGTALSFASIDPFALTIGNR